MEREVFIAILNQAVSEQCSDIHFKADYSPFFRINGFLVEKGKQPLSAKHTFVLANYLLEGRGLFLLQKGNAIYINDMARTTSELFTDVDTSYEIPNHTRFRVNIYRNRGSIGIAMRIIPYNVKGFKELNLPAAIEKICTLRRGLVLVTGPTGMGKSTTIAAILNHINQTRTDHILTVEDPIEFILQPRQSVVTQREIPTDVRSFAEAVNAAMRQNPDVLMIGEMRTADTVEIGLKAAETGHLVISSLHTPTAMQTISRFLSFYDSASQPIARLRLAENLMAIVSLRLLPQIDRPGMIPAVEILRTTRIIQECMKTPERNHEIPGFMAKSRDYGMQTFDQHLIELIQAKKVSLAVGLSAATSPSDLERTIQFGD